MESVSGHFGAEEPVVRLGSSYLIRHNVSLEQLDDYQIRCQSDVTNPGLSWVEVAEIATYVAFHWNSKDGKLSSYEDYVAAVNHKIKFAFASKITERIKLNREHVKNSVNKSLESGHVFKDLEPQDPDDEHGGPRYR